VLIFIIIIIVINNNNNNNNNSNNNISYKTQKLTEGEGKRKLVSVHDMKSCGEVEVELHALVTAARGGG
jgi:uncharacterized membrane protein